MLVVRRVLFLALLTASAADAQEPRAVDRSVSTGGITVTGRGTAFVVPDRARVSIILAGANSTSVSVDDAADAVRDDLKANGVADAHVVLPMGNLSLRQAAPAIVGTIAKPTRERVETMAQNVVKAFPDRFAPIIANVQIQLTLLADDCGPDEDRAERAAFADARRRAERIATSAGVRLGAVTSVVALQTEQPGGCATKPDPIFSNANFGLGPFTNPYGPLTIPIAINETVTFGILAL